MSSRDKIIPLASHKATQSPASPVPANVEMAGDFLLAPSFGDPETLLNSRDWLQGALTSSGATVVGGGCGGGQADLDIDLQGCRFNVSIRPR